MTVHRTHPDWPELLDMWDRQQAGYLPHREQRFTAMLDALQALVGDSPLALDFACGPGSISQRLLERLASARTVAVDQDPVLLAIGRGALGSMGGRLKWVQADLRRSDWTTLVGDEPFDAVLSSTAVHWLEDHELTDAYRRIAAVLRPGGIALLADNMPFDPAKRVLRGLVSTLERERQDRAFVTGGAPDWERWWASLAAHPDLADVIAERERELRPLSCEAEDPSASADVPLLGDGGPTFSQHVASLTDAGFAEVDVIWQDLDDRVLAGVRSWSR